MVFYRRVILSGRVTDKCPMSPYSKANKLFALHLLGNPLPLVPRKDLALSGQGQDTKTTRRYLPKTAEKQ